MCKCFDGKIIRKGRAHYLCAHCKQDISFAVCLLVEADPAVELELVSEPASELKDHAKSGSETLQMLDAILDAAND